MNRIYFDTFENSYTFEKEGFAPPERYYEIILSSGVFYTETWGVASEYGYARVNISYLKEDIENKGVQYLREATAEEYSIRFLYMVRWAIPKEEYDKIYKEVISNVYEK